jgi:hypothetical protein
MCLIYVAAYLIRPESFIFGSLALIPVLIKKLIQNKKFQIKFLFFISITLIFITFDYLTEINFYKSSSQWTEYRNLETARYKIQANRIEEALKENPKKYNWTENEVKLFEQYITIDKKVFNESKYNRLINQVNSDLQKNSVKDFIFIGHKNLIDSDINWEWFNLGKLIPISFLLFAFLFWPRGGHFLLLTFVSYLFLYFAMLYISFYLRQPERVQVSAIFIAILIPFAAGASNVDKKIDFNNLTNNIIQFLLIILVVSYAIPQIRYLDKKYSGANSIFWIKEQEILSQLPANSIFIGNASQFRNNWSNPYSVRQSEVENRIMTLGWHNYSPHWKTRAQRLGLDPENMWNSIINNKNVYFLSDEETFNFVRKYLEEQRIIYNNVEKVRSFDFVGNDYNIWKFN